MDPESTKKIDEIMFETNDKINAIVEEIRLIRFSKMNEKEKEKEMWWITKRIWKSYVFRRKSNWRSNEKVF